MKNKPGAYPQKSALNLAMREKSPFSPLQLLPLLLALILLAGLFGKFAVADRLSAVTSAEAELSALRQRQAELTASTASYEALSQRYAQYSTGWMTEDEQAAVPRLEMLSLVEAELMPDGQVRRLSVSGNLLSVDLDGVTLESAARFVQKLYQRPDVTNVAVYTASAGDASGGQGAVTLIITMNLPKEGGEQP